MDTNRLLSNAASVYLVGLFQARARKGSPASQTFVVPDYLLDLGCLGAWCFDIDSQQWSLSASLVDTLQAAHALTRVDFEGSNIQSFVHPDDAALFEEVFTAARRTPGLRELSHGLCLPDTREIKARSYIYSLGAAAEATSIVGAIFDVQTESRTLLGLRSIDHRSKIPLEEDRDGLFDWDIEAGRISYSARAAELMGMADGQSAGTFEGMLKLLHPADRERTRKSLRDNLSGLTDFLDVEVRIRHEDGRYHWILVRGKTLRDIEGHPLRLLGLSTDIDDRKSSELALRETEEWLRGAVEGSFDAIIILKSVRSEAGEIVDFEVVELNERIEDHAGRTRSEILGRRLTDLPSSCLPGVDFDRLVHVVEERLSFDEEAQEAAPTGSLLWLHRQCVPVGDGVALTIADITTRKTAEQVLLDNQRFIEKLAHSLPEFVYVVDIEETHISYQNRDFIGQLGYPSDMFARGLLSLSDLVHPEEMEANDAYRKAIRSADDDQVVEVTCRLRTANDEWRWFTIRSVVFRRDDHGEPVELIRTIHDVSVQMQSEAELREKVRQLRTVQMELRERQDQLEDLNQRLAALATTDGLTGLYNYRAFHEKLAEEARRAARYSYPLSIVLADVDDFKAYNDRYGHPAGDERLRQFARMLTDDSRDSDYVARYGGEEFAMILINTTAEDAGRYAQRLIDRLNKEAGQRQITASFGCSQLEPEDKSTDELIHRADDCLYAAKRAGKNQYVVAGTNQKPVGTPL